MKKTAALMERLAITQPDADEPAARQRLGVSVET